MEGLLWQLHPTSSYFPQVWRWMGRQYVQIPGQKSVSNSKDTWLEGEYSFSQISEKDKKLVPQFSFWLIWQKQKPVSSKDFLLAAMASLSGL